VEIKISELVATVEINEIFWNDSDLEQRVTYFFPIPENSIISEFKMKIGDKYYTGEIMDSVQARQAFSELVKQNKNPALLEFMDDNYYKIEIPSFKAHEERAISLKYIQELKKENGIVKLQYPLEIESLLKASIKKIKITGEIISENSEIFFVDSSTNEIQSDIEKNKHNASFSFIRENYHPNNDFILKYGLGENEVEAYMSTDSPDLGYNTFLLEIHPDINFDNYQPKDVVFVLDKSGSMSGIKYNQAQDAAKFILSRLYDEDRFNTILFNHDITVFKHIYNLFDNDMKQEAIDWIYSSYAAGNTNIYGSLDMALRVFQNNGNVKNPILVFLTDGVPTEGIIHPETIVNHVNQMALTIPGLRIFAFGVGYDVNTYILDLLITNNNGQTFYVTEEESIETEVAKLFSNISKPVLSDVKLEFFSESIEIIDYIPNTGLTVYKDEPLKVYGRYKGIGELKMKLSGKLGDKNFEKTYTFQIKNSSNKSISLLWASRQISHLINKIRLYGETTELKDEVINLSKQFSIPTQYTSYLVSDEGFDDSTVMVKQQTTASTSPYFSYTSAGSVNSPASAPKTQTGKIKVLQSKNMNQMSMAKQLEDTEELMKQAMSELDFRLLYGKRFVWNDDKKAWIDDEFEEENVVTIKKYSDEYFELITKNKELIDFLQLTDSIYINLNEENFIFED
jgi:Ca-activated chloride channel family protein